VYYVPGSEASCILFYEELTVSHAGACCRWLLLSAIRAKESISELGIWLLAEVGFNDSVF
jgi:hypothetical protein